nr:uncharacterized protein LOC117687243 [Crassostrea gigas]
METAISPYKIHQCSKCTGDTEYYCVSCPCDLCPQCKEIHVKDLKTIDHDVVSHRDKINYISTQEIYVRHPSNVNIKYCEACELPICYHCNKQKQQQSRGTIHTIRSEALFNRPVLLPRIKDDFKTCRTNFSRYQSEMITKAQTLKNLINKVKKDFMHNVFCEFDFKHRCLKQKIIISRHIVSLQRYVNIYEQSAFTFSALQFLSSIKKVLTEVHLTLHTSQLSMTESYNQDDVMESLSAIQITERGNRRVGNQCLLKLMSVAEFHQSLTVTDVDCCRHISCVTSNRVWVSDGNNLTLINKTGVPLHRVQDLCNDLDVDFYGGLHTVNRESEMIYIDRNHNINKLSKDMKTTTTFVKRTSSTWKPCCVYCSPSTGDLLVGMHSEAGTGKVTRYNQSGQLTQTIQNCNTGRGWYILPNYITENNNGDVVVSYIMTAVVVRERGGRHRFEYTGPPSRPGLHPLGICTDALSHILVCDQMTNTVQMLNKDGQFLSHLLIRPSEIFYPRSLSYDLNTHRLLVGSKNKNVVVIYRYITRRDTLTNLNLAPADVMESLSQIPTKSTEKPQQGIQCLLKLLPSPELLHSITLTSVDGCRHISCVTSDQAWVSDVYKLILTDTADVFLHCVQDFLDSFFCRGLHTVNNESELIYIDKNYNINKLSKDMKTATTFIKKTGSTWKPLCLYWSPFTGDLLVGMYRKVTRYNQSGQLTQTIQHDNKGLGLYREPSYLTENNNGDVVVSDSDNFTGAVVVTERGGRHRFSYTGHLSGSLIQPGGVCTDALSHILVCDVNTDTVQILDKDGHFLSHFLISPSGISQPHILSYDVSTHCLWVGSWYDNIVEIYRYITTQDSPTDEHPRLTDEEIHCMASS